MLTLILLLVVGSILAYLSQNNLAVVSVSLGSYVIQEVPLFYVIMGSLLTGLMVSYVISLIHGFFVSMELRAKGVEIKKGKDEVLELTKLVHQLELEKEKLKHNSPEEKNDPLAL